LLRPGFQAGNVALGRRVVTERHQGRENLLFGADDQPVFIEAAFHPGQLQGDVVGHGARQDFEGNDDTGDAGDLAEVRQALRFEGKAGRAGGQLGQDRRRQFLCRQAVGVVTEQQVDGLQGLFLQREEGHFFDGQQAVEGTVQVGQRCHDQIARGGVVLGDCLADVAETAAAERLADQRVVGGECRDRTDAGQRSNDLAAFVQFVQGGRFELAILGKQTEQRLGAGCRVVARLVQAAQFEQGVAHRDRPADQVLLQAVVRQAQQVVLAGQVLQALVEVELDGFRPPGAGQPQAGELAGQHDQDQATEEEQLGEIVSLTDIEQQPGGKQQAGAGQPG